MILHDQHVHSEYSEDSQASLDEYYEIAKKEGSERAACDFISGMTDAYSIKTFTDLFVPKTWSV